MAKRFKIGEFASFATHDVIRSTINPRAHIRLVDDDVRWNSLPDDFEAMENDVKSMDKKSTKDRRPEM